ncbi:MAG: hypothetical protein AB7T06_25540 [Kofleriaceae bacterium]
MTKKKTARDPQHMDRAELLAEIAKAPPDPHFTTLVQALTLKTERDKPNAAEAQMLIDVLPKGADAIVWFVMRAGTPAQRLDLLRRVYSGEIDAKDLVFVEIVPSSWNAARIFTELSPYMTRKPDALAAKCIRALRSAAVDVGLVDKRWVPFLFDLLTDATRSTQEAILFVLDAIADAQGKRAFPTNATDTLLELLDALPEQGDLVALLAKLGDPRVANVFVDKLSTWKDTDALFEALRSMRKKTVAAALVAKGPITFRTKVRDNKATLAELMETLAVHMKPGKGDAAVLLRKAIEDGDVDAVERLLDDGADPNAKIAEEPASALIHAIRCVYENASSRDTDVRLDIVRRLLARGARTTTKLAWEWDCGDRAFTKADTAITIVHHLLEAVTPPYLAPLDVDADDVQIYPWYDDDTRVVMRPVVKKLVALVGSKPKPRPKTTSERRRAAM